MGLVDREELKKIRAHVDCRARAIHSIYKVAETADEESIYAKHVVGVLVSLHETLAAAARERKEICPVLYLSGLAQYGFVVMSRTTDMEKLCNSPVLVKFFQILDEEEVLRPFIKTISVDEALYFGVPSGGNYIFVRLP